MADGSTAPDWRLAVDIGGTFTDVVLIDAASGRVVVDKTLTTPAAPLDGVRTGVRQLLAKAGVRPAEITAPIVHATTLITNALIEGKIGRAGVVTTEGFGDTMLIRDEHRYDMYDLQIEFPSPPVPRDRVVEIAERTNPQGDVIEAPTAAGLEAITTALRNAKVESVGVCLINAYANPANERLIAEHLRRELGVPVCISAEISPQIREYPRMITTACNAATMPVIGPYLDELQKWLAAEGFGGSVLMMLSNGGVVSADDAARAPIRLVESGPAAGALAGSWFARRLGEDPSVVLRHGRHHGQVVPDRRWRTGDHQHVRGRAHLPVQEGLGVPRLGAVGRPRRDRRRRWQPGAHRRARTAEGRPRVVRCRSRARRATAAVARRPAVTDADLALGLLDAGYFLGGDMPLDLAANDAALRSIADGLGLPVSDTAAGIHELVNQNMAAAARMHAVEQGEDLRGVTVLAFGGAGPIHACGVAELLDSPRVIFPVNASVLSAFGTLVSPVRIDLARSMVRSLSAISHSERDRLLDDLRDEGRRVLAAAGVPGDRIRFRYGLDARYLGQGNELTIWVGDGDQWPVTDEEVVERFESDYRRIYGLTIPDVAVEAVTWRLSAYANADTVEPLAEVGEAHGQPRTVRAVRFERSAAAVDTPVYRRTDLGRGQRLSGPAIVEERETTAVIRPGWVVEVADDGSLVAERSI